tara:strand:- start:574 stop:699 length:126 start_codon:yes stop_codon:yes gene_type:complete
MESLSSTSNWRSKRSLKLSGELGIDKEVLISSSKRDLMQFY